MSDDITERLRNVAETFEGPEALDEEVATCRQAADEIERAASYAEHLACAIWERHYKDDAPHWKPLSGDVLGLLTQIDNMTAGLSRNQRISAPTPNPDTETLENSDSNVDFAVQHRK